MKASFNMGHCNPLHTLKSGCMIRDRSLKQPLPCVGEKFLSYVGHWMKCLGAQIAEIAAKMLATAWVQSNCSSLDGAEDGEHNGVHFVDISKILAAQHAFFFGLLSFGTV